MSESHWQFERPNPMKPHVHKKTRNGMWWATARDSEGKYYVDCFSNHEDALAKAYEYAAMNKESAK